MNTKRAFTLVEILTVTVIIGILVTLVAVAVAAAMQAAKRGRIAMEMSQIAMALERYKAEFGEYPPDMFDDDALVRHVKKRWPRLDMEELVTTTGAADYAAAIRTALQIAYNSCLGSTNVKFQDTQTEAGSLVLWLGGFPNADGKLSGFFADPENPFTPSDAFDNKVFVDLTIGDNNRVRLFSVGSNRVVPVIGTEIRDTFVPFVYFRGKSDGGSDAYVSNGQVKQFDFSVSGLGLCVPYKEDVDEVNGSETIMKWKNPTTFQLLHPGLDGKFSETTETERIIKSGSGISSADLDNLTNFSEYKELKSILP